MELLPRCVSRPDGEWWQRRHQLSGTETMVVVLKHIGATALVMYVLLSVRTFASCLHIQECCLLCPGLCVDFYSCRSCLAHLAKREDVSLSQAGGVVLKLVMVSMFCYLHGASRCSVGSCGFSSFDSSVRPLLFSGEYEVFSGRRVLG